MIEILVPAKGLTLDHLWEPSPLRLWSTKDVLKKTGATRQTLTNWLDAGRWPQPGVLTGRDQPNPARGWTQEQVEEALSSPHIRAYLLTNGTRHKL